MANLIDSLDTISMTNTTSLEPKQYTEKGNKAYGWAPEHNYECSNDNDENIKERIIQFYFQTTMDNKDASPRWMQHKYMNLSFITLHDP